MPKSSKWNLHRTSASRIRWSYIAMLGCAALLLIVSLLVAREGTRDQQLADPQPANAADSQVESGMLSNVMHAPATPAVTGSSPPALSLADNAWSDPPQATGSFDSSEFGPVLPASAGVPLRSASHVSASFDDSVPQSAWDAQLAALSQQIKRFEFDLSMQLDSATTPGTGAQRFDIDVADIEQQAAEFGPENAVEPNAEATTGTLPNDYILEQSSNERN